MYPFSSQVKHFILYIKCITPNVVDHLDREKKHVSRDRKKKKQIKLPLNPLDLSHISIW